MVKSLRFGAVVALAGLSLLPSGTGLAAARADGAGRAPLAAAASSVRATDVAHLHYLRHSGSLLIEEGSATGTLAGRMLVHCNIANTVTASFTIFTHDGTIKGHGTATPHGAGIYESFEGSLVATGGTGRYAHAHGHAGLYGVFNRRTYALTIQTTGQLSS
jgi:hypothetical protein